jgi:hypothetical protein
MDLRWPDFIAGEIAEYGNLLYRRCAPAIADFPIEAVIRRLDGMDGWQRSQLLPPPVEDSVAAISERFGAAVAGCHAKLVVLDMIRRFPERVRRQTLPPSVLALTPEMLTRVLRSLPQADDAAYVGTEGTMAVDTRLAAGLAVPCGRSQLVDLSSYLPATFFRYQGWRTNLKLLGFVLLRLKGRGPLLRVHTDARNLADFTKAGWDRCYLRMAELLRAFPQVLGLVGTSWFYDPQLDWATPQLRYLRQPLAHGAILRVDGATEVHTAWALAQSRRRRQLYDEGRYRPVCCTLVWPRAGLLRWAAEHQGGQ